MKYTITVSQAELEVISLAIGRMPDAKPVRERSAPLHRPVASTGDAELDAWMNRQYARGVKPYVKKPPPAPRLLKPRKWSDRELQMLDSFNEKAVSAWRRLGHEVIVKGNRVDRDGSNVTVLPLPERDEAR